MAGKKTIRVEEGRGNVFADLGFPNPEREQLRARLTLQIYHQGAPPDPSQGEILGIKQPMYPA